MMEDGGKLLNVAGKSQGFIDMTSNREKRFCKLLQTNETVSESRARFIQFLCVQLTMLCFTNPHLFPLNSLQARDPTDGLLDPYIVASSVRR